MIRYSRYVEPAVPQQRAVPKSPSPKPRTVVVSTEHAATEPAPTSPNTDRLHSAAVTLSPGVEQLELTAPDGPPSKARKSKSSVRRPKTQPADDGTAPAFPLLTGIEV